MRRRCIDLWKRYYLCCHNYFALSLSLSLYVLAAINRITIQPEASNAAYHTGGSSLFKAYQRSIQCFHHYFPFAFTFGGRCCAYAINKSGSLINHIFYERLCSKNSFTLMGVPQLLTRQNLSFLNSVYRPASPMFRVNFPILCKQNNMPCLGITGR